MAAAHDLYKMLIVKVDELYDLGATPDVPPTSSDSIYRACIVLAVSALDTYMHEKSVETFMTSIQKNSTTTTGLVAQYLGIPSDHLSRKDAYSIVKYRLSFRTLITATAIDDAIAATGHDAADVWRSIGISLTSRESRLRNMLDLQADRRNQIAHEGDWDPALLELRSISPVHAQECRSCITKVVNGIETYWRP